MPDGQKRVADVHGKRRHEKDDFTVGACLNTLSFCPEVDLAHI